jgi:GcrA cell cycle regulator
MEWNEDTIVRLREFWAEGHSTAEIGRRLGVSKNAIVGKAHRLDLPARPSPIRREASSLEAVLQCSSHRPEGTTLPPLPSIAEVKPPPPVSVPVVPAAPVARAVGTTAAPVRAPVPRPVPPPAPPRIQVVTPRPYARIVTCCWPIGEPGTRSFRFCEEPSDPGKPYCAEHAKVAYVKVRDRREDAA